MLLSKRINFNQIKSLSLQFSINILDQLQARQISLVGPKILQCHQGVTKLIIKKFAFRQSIKAIKKNSKLKADFLERR